jgi:hypothetical protein
VLCSAFDVITLNFDFKYIAKRDIISTKELMDMNEKTVNFTLRMTPELRFQLERIAHNEDRTLSNLINMALKRYVDVYNGVKK